MPLCSAAVQPTGYDTVTECWIDGQCSNVIVPLDTKMNQLWVHLVNAPPQRSCRQDSWLIWNWCYDLWSLFKCTGLSETALSHSMSWQSNVSGLHLWLLQHSCNKTETWSCSCSSLVIQVVEKLTTAVKSKWKYRIYSNKCPHSNKHPPSLLEKDRPESQKPLITAPPQNESHSELEFHQSLLDLKVDFLLTFLFPKDNVLCRNYYPTTNSPGALGSPTRQTSGDTVNRHSWESPKNAEERLAKTFGHMPHNAVSLFNHYSSVTMSVLCVLETLKPCAHWIVCLIDVMFFAWSANHTKFFLHMIPRTAL